MGGEQTLFAVTAEGKVYATGYGAGGRLGIGGSDSVCQPTLLESIQHVCIRTIAVNSGGKHCLALSVDGEVYSWGEGDGKNCSRNNDSILFIGQTRKSFQLFSRRQAWTWKQDVLRQAKNSRSSQR